VLFRDQPPGVEPQDCPKQVEHPFETRAIATPEHEAGA
jgi:hypothetical protein